jgi:hypothetical protein
VWYGPYLSTLIRAIVEPLVQRGQVKAKPFSLIAALVLFVTVFAADPAHSQQQRGVSSSSQINSMPAARSSFSGQAAGQIARPSVSGTYDPSYTGERTKSQIGSVDNRIKSTAAEIDRSRRGEDVQKQRVIQQSKKDEAIRRNQQETINKRREMQRSIECLSSSGC